MIRCGWSTALRLLHYDVQRFTLRCIVTGRLFFTHGVVCQLCLCLCITTFNNFPPCSKTFVLSRVVVFLVVNCFVVCSGQMADFPLYNCQMLNTSTSICPCNKTPLRNVLESKCGITCLPLSNHHHGFFFFFFFFLVQLSCPSCVLIICMSMVLFFSQ